MQAAPASILHPRASAFASEPRSTELRIGLLFAGTGIAIFAVMGVLGLVMRLTQATVIDLSPAWFYRLMTVHGTGMITGALLVMMGALWFVVRETVALDPRRMYVSFGLIVSGLVCVVVAGFAGGFGAGWTFLPPLPFFPAGQWSTWAVALYFVAMLLVGAGFFVFCADILASATATYGGLRGALGIRYLFDTSAEPPPPQVIAATVIAIDGLFASTVGATIVVGLLGRTYDDEVRVDALVAKNLSYFFGHEIANLLIYMAAGAVYVLVPRYAGRPYRTTRVFVAAWMGSLVFLLTAYSHHLYMDFVQPQWAQIVSAITSYTAALPVAVITIYSMMMLVWGSRYRWTLASTLLYLGFTGWAIGGVGAVIDSVIPLNFRLHNTTWVVAHFHTYLLLTVILWGLAFLTHLIEREAGETAPPRRTAVAAGLMLVGGYGLTGTWFVEGVLGVPRRYAIQPPGTARYSLVGSIFAIVFALGLLVYLRELAALARTGWQRRHWVLIGEGPQAHYHAPEARPERRDEPPPPHRLAPVGLPLASPAQLAVGVAAATVALASFFPQIVEASETSTRYHHLDHAGHFFCGAMLGLVLGSLPGVSLWLGERSGWGLAGVIIAPTAMLFVMVPSIYEPLETHALYHALYHLGMGGFGLVTGIAGTRLGLVAGRLSVTLSVGMTLMFAAAMT